MARPTQAPKVRKKKAEEAEEHENEERWLVSYADMLTVLFCLFVVLFAMSSLDTAKFATLAESLRRGFGLGNTLLQGSSSILNGNAADTNGVALNASTGTPNTSQSQQSLAQQVAQQVQQQMAQQTQRQAAEAKADVQDLIDLWDRIEQLLQSQGLEDNVQASVDDRGLVISVISKRIVFDLASPTMTDLGKQIVDTIAPVLQAIPENLEIDGHSNQLPIHTAQFPTDWEISAANAVNVLRYLQDNYGIPGERLRATSFSLYKPLIDPNDPAAFDVNKRVDIVVLSDSDGATRDRYNLTLQELKDSGETLPEGLS